MSDLEAVPTNNVYESYTKLLNIPIVKKAEDRSKKIATLANSDGFHALQEEINEMIRWLREIHIDPSDTPETIGFRYLAMKVAVEKLEQIRDLPERYKEQNNG